MHRQCPFCHQMVPIAQYRAHIQQHTQLRPDGQMRDHATLAPQYRTGGSLSDVPRVYYHAVCGASTQMPEDIVRTYLVDPCFYNKYTFCTGCQDYLHQREFVWQETGENLDDYQRRLFRSKSLGYKIVYWLTSPLGTFLFGLLIGLVIGAIIGTPTAIFISLVVGAAAGFLFGLGVGRFVRLAIVKARIV